jgi:hypothetical protein
MSAHRRSVNSIPALKALALATPRIESDAWLFPVPISNDGGDLGMAFVGLQGSSQP